ncbi:MAG: patatin-like phospholipase family protein, partial [Acidimicrobiia bacterium]
SRPTAIVAHDIRTGTRTAFGTEEAPNVGLAEAVAASSAIPLVFRPYAIGDDLYVDGGVSSGTHADLVLGTGTPLDLVLVIAPMAADVQRKRARFHEKIFDRVGSKSLNDEMALIRDAWPDTDIVVLRPSPSVQNASRPNPMDASRSVPTFMRTVISMKRTLAKPEIWSRLDNHLVDELSSTGLATAERKLVAP